MFLNLTGHDVANLHDGQLINTVAAQVASHNTSLTPIGSADHLTVGRRGIPTISVPTHADNE